MEVLKSDGYLSWSEFMQGGNTLDIYDVAIIDGRVSQTAQMAAVKKHEDNLINIDLAGEAGTHVELEIWRNDNPGLVAAKYVLKDNQYVYLEWSAITGKPVRQKKSIYGGVDVDLNELSVKLLAGNQWPNDSTIGIVAILQIDAGGVGLGRESRLNQPEKSHWGRAEYDRRIDFQFHTTY